MKIVNSLTGEKEEFKPANPKKVTIYNCGPTVYNFNHIGNFRSYMFVDLLRRYLLFRGFGVDHTSNITDVDDKIIDRAVAGRVSIEQFTGPFIEAFLEDLKTLRIQNVEHRPRATDSMKEIITMIQELDKKGHTYVQDGNVYFRISSYDKYGKLSHIDPSTLKTAAGGRFDADEYDKEDVRDFALWKKPADENEPSWQSPYGNGRPGWHIECSAMIRNIYGKNGIDIHIGGIDLLFPHHENEIAQSCCAYPADNFVRYWMHNEHLLVEGKKMSKSLGNFYTLRDLTQTQKAEQLVKNNQAPAFVLEFIKAKKMDRALRYLLISTHYRTKLNFTFDNLKAADSAMDRLQHIIYRLCAYTGHNQNTIEKKYTELANGASVGTGGNFLCSLSSPVKETANGFIDAMDDDLNIAKALGFIFDLIRNLNASYESGKLSKEIATDALLLFYGLSLLLDHLHFGEKEEAMHNVEEALKQKVEALLEERTSAKKAKNFQRADEIRKQLESEGVIIKDTPSGTVWEVK